MKISQHELRTILPDDLMKKAGLGNSYKMANIVRRYYCTPMAIAGKCPTDCQQCSTRLQGLVEKIANDKTVNNPVGVFIYNMRNLVNDAVETAPAPIVKKKDKLGIPIEDPKGTVWDKMMASL